MGVIREYFINGSDFSNATSVYTDAALTNCAPDGFYSFGGVVRELIGCELAPPQDCVDCTEVCGGEGITVIDAVDGVYHTDFVTNDDAGAVVFEITPGDCAIGVYCNYNSVNYNILSSATQGDLRSATSSRPTYIGPDTAVYGPLSGTVDIFNYEQGGFVDTGSDATFSQLPGDNNLTPIHPGVCYMVIPKITSTADTITMSIETLTPDLVNFHIKAHCPQLLTPIMMSTKKTSEPLACDPAVEADQTKYHYPVNGVAGADGLPGIPGLYDLVFQDQYGTLKQIDGFYYLGDIYTSQWVCEIVDGVIVSITSCI